MALGLAGALLLLGAAPAQPSPGPAGIFVIGDTRPVAGEVAKFDFDFVSGYTLRIPWSELETWNAATQSPQYNFSRIDTTLEELRARGKRMTIEIFVSQVPDHVLVQPGVITWINPHPTQGGEQVVPWDSRALAAYRLMIQGLANHQVAGTGWRVAEHPALETVDAPIVGLQGLRELSNTLVNHPGYRREQFIQGVVESVAISRQAFPNKFGFLALFAMDDGTAVPALDDAVYERLMTEFNVPGKPSLGFFQETLSDAGPRLDGLGWLLNQAAPHTYIMFQALRPWALRDGEVRPPEIASGTPVTGIEFAWANYGSSYVELYGADILAAGNWADLRIWNRRLNEGNAVSSGEGAPVITTQPASQTVTAGSSPTFTAAASGTPPLSYQWRKDGANISGATSATFTLASVATAAAGSYTVVVTNPAGSATSNAATLTVTIPASPAVTPSNGGGGGGGAPTLWFCAALSLAGLGRCLRRPKH